MGEEHASVKYHGRPIPPLENPPGDPKCGNCGVSEVKFKHYPESLGRCILEKLDD